ncbi:MAG TPA: hypothetical protein VN696_09760 [Pyrinomonadaceae bacterium]|nr:hypothetical protein [Pyrinomonadaceae bacterium]
MRNLFIAVSVLCVLTVASAKIVAQSDLDKLDDKFSRHLEKVLPGWTHDRGEPVVKGENVLIQYWYSPNKAIKISVMPYKSATDARAALEDFVRYERDRTQLKDFGDDGYAWGFAESKVVFIKGKLLVFVSSRVEAGSSPEERALGQDQRFEREKDEMRKWSREFAKHAANAVDDQ